MITLVRGLPGSGKTTYAKSLGVARVSADDFMYAGGQEYSASRVAASHARCFERTSALAEVGDVAVDNIFSQRWNVWPYAELSEELGVELRVVDLYLGGLSAAECCARSEHSVPPDHFARLVRSWDHLLSKKLYEKSSRPPRVVEGLVVRSSKSDLGCWLRVAHCGGTTRVLLKGSTRSVGETVRLEGVEQGHKVLVWKI